MADTLLIITAGGRRYAVPQHHIRTLQRGVEHQSLTPMATLLDTPAGDDEAYVLVIADSSGTLLGVHQADLYGTLPHVALPDWLTALVHPAVIGLALDDTELVPLVDLVRLARQIGHETA